jgi:predicted dehydrogenase
MNLSFKNKPFLLLLTLLNVGICISGKAQQNKPISPAKEKERLIILDPVHPHSAQMQQSLKKLVNPEVYLYAPHEEDLKDNYLNLVLKNNKADTSNKPWKVNSYIGADFLERLLKEKKGNTVILASNNSKKAKYSLALAKAGFNILIDKPMALTPDDFKALNTAFQFAATNKRYITDIPAMTMRNLVICNLQKELAAIPEIYGQQEQGSLGNPAIIQENVHHYRKSVLRPTYFFDVKQQGLGVAEVTTHLIDLVQWISFSNTPLNYTKDINVLTSKVWATTLTPTQFNRVTSHSNYPEFLKKDLRDSILHVYSNGEINYKLKNIHTQIISKWDYQAKPGTGDTHRSVMKGSKSTLSIKSGKPQDLYIEPKQGADLKAFETALQTQVERLRKKYPSLELLKEEKGWRLHSSTRVSSHANDLIAPSKWETEGMLAKYYTTTQAVLKVKYVK